MGIPISIKLIDAYGRTSTKRVELATDVVATAVTDAPLVATALATASDCGLVSCTILVDSGATPTTPTAGGNLDAGVSIQGLLAGTTGKYATLKIPAPLAAYIDPDGSVDLANATLKAYLDYWTEAVIKCLISDGEEVDSWIKGTLDR
jgi:hypothetical protein